MVALPVMSKRPQIVVIEDESSILDVIEYNLVQAGFGLLTAADGVRGLKLVQQELPDLVVLDVMLPGRDGHEVCRAIRNDAATALIPVLMLTALDHEDDVVHGLGIGADDYMSKPFSPRELVARVKALLRRQARTAVEDDDNGHGDVAVQAGPLQVDASRHDVRIDGVEISLTRTELRILEVMVRRPGRVYTRDQLVQRVMGDDVEITDRTIDVHIRAIRRKLGDRADVIETIRGVGYRVRDAKRTET